MCQIRWFTLYDDLQDAHEFLAQCLDQLKEDCLSVPVSSVWCEVAEVLVRVLLTVEGGGSLSCVPEL